MNSLLFCVVSCRRCLRDWICRRTFRLCKCIKKSCASLEDGLRSGVVPAPPWLDSDDPPLEVEYSVANAKRKSFHNRGGGGRGGGGCMITEGRQSLISSFLQCRFWDFSWPLTLGFITNLSHNRGVAGWTVQYMKDHEPASVSCFFVGHCHG